MSFRQLKTERKTTKEEEDIIIAQASNPIPNPAQKKSQREMTYKN